MSWVVGLVALGVSIGELSRRARLRRALEESWRREDAETLRRLREQR